jgi:hypothetical protein
MAGRDRPGKLATFRFTSRHEHLITEIAALYGGEAKPWQSPNGAQLEVITATDTVPVYVPPQRVDPWYEQWGKGVCTRRCDGERDIVHDSPCDCDPEERSCKPVVRLNVMLADVQGLGVWRLETHGMNAISELAMLAELLSRVSMPLPARLVLRTETRKFFNREKQKVEKREFPVPSLLFDQVTARQVQIGGDALTQAVTGGVGAQTAIGSSQAAPGPAAVAATPALPPATGPVTVDQYRATVRLTPNEVMGQIASATDPEQIKALWTRLSAEKVSFGPEIDRGLKDRMVQKAQQLSTQIRARQAAEAARQQTPVTAYREGTEGAETVAVLPPMGRDPWDYVPQPAADPWPAEPVTPPATADPIDQGAQPDPWAAGLPPQTAEDPWPDPAAPGAAEPPPEISGSPDANQPAAVAPEPSGTPQQPPPDKTAVWMSIMGLAGQMRWSSGELSDQMFAQTGVRTPADATVEQLVQFRSFLQTYGEQA